MLRQFFAEAPVPQRMPILVSGLLLLSAVFPSAAQRRNQPPPLIRTVDGAEIFADYCGACHGEDGRGNGPASLALKRPGPDLTRLSRRNGGSFPVIHVKNTITFGNDELIPAHGSKQMPMWGPIFHEIEFDHDFGNVRVENLTKYLESLQQK